jgi:hypothetical protein
VHTAERAARQTAWQSLTDQGQAQMREVSPATRSAVVDAIQSFKPDIIHYYGHGRYTDAGALLFDEPNARHSWISVDRLMTLFGDARLVALYACQGAMLAADDNVSPLTGIAQALSAAGVPLVLGMQLTTRIDAATRAAAKMYGALANGASVQDAVNQARQALYIEEDDQCSWYVPTLYIRSRDTGPVYIDR